MAELEQILNDVAYAETIEHTFESGLQVSIAEAHPMRNRAYQAGLLKMVTKDGVAEDKDLDRPAFIRLVTGSLLKGWNVTRDGEPVPVSEACDILTANADYGGFEICSTIDLIARQPARFRQEPSKKKPSSTTTPKARSSATRRKSSKTKRNPAASRSRRASKAS